MQKHFKQVTRASVVRLLMIECVDVGPTPS